MTRYDVAGSIKPEVVFLDGFLKRFDINYMYLGKAIPYIIHRVVLIVAMLFRNLREHLQSKQCY